MEVPVFRSVSLVSMLLGGAAALSGCASLAAEEANTPKPYLEQALKAVQQRDATAALADLNRAESMWIGSNVPFSDAFFGFDPDAMREMARARQSVQMQRWGDAEYYIRTALTHPSVVTPN